MGHEGGVGEALQACCYRRANYTLNYLHVAPLGLAFGLDNDLLQP